MRCAADKCSVQIGFARAGAKFKLTIITLQLQVGMLMKPMKQTISNTEIACSGHQIEIGTSNAISQLFQSVKSNKRPDNDAITRKCLYFEARN